MSRKKFEIIDPETDEKYKIDSGEMIVMNTAGVFFLVGGMGDYYTGIRKLSDVLPKYDVVWK